MNRIDKETAIKLKEGGYDIPCDAYYLSDQSKLKKIRSTQDWNVAVNSYSAPYLDDMIDWLDNRAIHIEMNVKYDVVNSIIKPIGFIACIHRESETDNWVYDMVDIKSTRTAIKSAAIDMAISFVNLNKLV